MSEKENEIRPQQYRNNVSKGCFYVTFFILLIIIGVLSLLLLYHRRDLLNFEKTFQKGIKIKRNIINILDNIKEDVSKVNNSITTLKFGICFLKREFNKAVVNLNPE